MAQLPEDMAPLMVDEDELQRKELARLYSTARDEERKDLIRKAMVVHDEASNIKEDSKVNLHHLNPSIQASVFMNNGLPTLETRNARLRPVSARRRPSQANLLDSIPESLHSSSRKEMELPAEEVAEVVGSSFDPKCPADMVFRHASQVAAQSLHSSPSHTYVGSSSSSNTAIMSHSRSVTSIPENDHDHEDNPRTPTHSLYPSSNNSSNVNSSGLNSHSSLGNGLHRQWVCTGLVPQFLSITFYEKWLIRKVEVRCKGIERIAVHVNYSAASSFSPAKLIPLIRKADDRFEAEVVRPKSSDSAASPDEHGVHGIGLLVVVQQASGMFCSISQIRVIVYPQNR